MKLKVPPVIVFFLSLGIMFGISYFSKAWNYEFDYRVLLSRLFLAIGVVVAMLGIIAFRAKRTTVDPTKPAKASSLVTHGIYQFTRNPMYLGMAFVLMGGVIRTGNPLTLVAVLFFVWYITNLQIKPEEEVLIKLFGSEYAEYCRKVRRWM